MNICFMLLWNDSIATSVSCLACGILQLPTHHIVVLCIQWFLRYSMNQDALGSLVAMMSTCSCTHKTRSCPVDKLLNTLSSPKQIILLFGLLLLEFVLQHFMPMFYAHATNINKLWPLAKHCCMGKHHL
jgi:hypothetical protein